MAKSFIKAKTKLFLPQNFLNLCLNLHQVKTHDLRHQTKFIKRLNKRNKIELLAAQNRGDLKNSLLIHVTKSKIQETWPTSTYMII